jgi:ABC-type oligopeptide transport system ATPase subunit
LVIITTLTDDTERIRKISHKINNALLAAFPVMSKDEKKLNERSLLLQENKSPVRVEAILKWTILLHHNSEKMLSQINVLIEHIV